MMFILLQLLLRQREYLFAHQRWRQNFDRMKPMPGYTARATTVRSWQRGDVREAQYS